MSQYSKSRNKKVPLLLLLACTILSSCQKDIDIFTPYEEQTNNFSQLDGAIANFYERASIPASSFTIDPSQNNQISTPQLVLINIPEQAFISPDGSTVFGPVEIEIVESSTNQGSIKLQKPSVVNDQLQQAFTILYIMAIQNGQSLAIANGKSLAIHVPGIVPTINMEVYQTNNTDDRYFEWNKVLSNTEITTAEYQIPNITQNISGARFETDEMGWLGILTPISSTSGYTELQVILPQGYDPSNTSVFFVPEDDPIMVAELAWKFDSGTDLFSFKKIPVNLDGHIISISQWEDGLNAMGIQKIEFQAGAIKQSNLIPDLTEFEEIIEVLEDL